jgi:hypothetical protein
MDDGMTADAIAESGHAAAAEQLRTICGDHGGTPSYDFGKRRESGSMN